MRTLKFVFLACCILAISMSCSNKGPTEPEESIADYVKLSVSGGEPAFSFPKESGGWYESSYSDINYNSAGQVTSYHLSITFGSNTYNIRVYNIRRNSSGYTVAYTASITATIDGKKMSGTLTYP